MILVIKHYTICKFHLIFVITKKINSKKDFPWWLLMSPASRYSTFLLAVPYIARHQRYHHISVGTERNFQGSWRTIGHTPPGCQLFFLRRPSPCRRRPSSAPRRRVLLHTAVSSSALAPPHPPALATTSSSTPTLLVLLCRHNLVLLPRRRPSSAPHHRVLLRACPSSSSTQPRPRPSRRQPLLVLCATGPSSSSAPPRPHPPRHRPLILLRRRDLILRTPSDVSSCDAATSSSSCAAGSFSPEKIDFSQVHCNLSIRMCHLFIKSVEFVI
jgi:hypothetical protein